jgi:hypothetical protein
MFSPMCLTTLSSVPSQVRGNASDKAMGTWQRGRTGPPVILWVLLAGHSRVRTPTWRSATLAGQGGNQRRGLRGARPKRAPAALARAPLGADLWRAERDACRPPRPAPRPHATRDIGFVHAQSSARAATRTAAPQVGCVGGRGRIRESALSVNDESVAKVRDARVTRASA